MFYFPPVRGVRGVLPFAFFRYRFLYQAHPFLRQAQDSLFGRRGFIIPLRMERGGADYFYHVDGLGSITELTDSAGTIVQSYIYDSFGNVSVFDQIGAIISIENAIINPFTYTGRELDTETGLYYHRARYYDSSIGRFISEDPIRFDGDGPNLYGYTSNDPINFIDPLGLVKTKVFGQTIEIGISGTFLPINVFWDLEGFDTENFNLSGVFPPLSAGISVEIRINPPTDCEELVFSPFIGSSKDFSLGTNVIRDKENGGWKTQGLNINIGPAIGVPFGATIPIGND